MTAIVVHKDDLYHVDRSPADFGRSSCDLRCLLITLCSFICLVAVLCSVGDGTIDIFINNEEVDRS